MQNFTLVSYLLKLIFSRPIYKSTNTQIPVDEESQQYLTINTRLGLFRVKQLHFEVNAAVGIFQRIICNVLKGSTGVCVYLDDILVTGRNNEQHLHVNQAVLEHLKDARSQVKKLNCTFLKPSDVYLILC